MKTNLQIVRDIIENIDSDGEKSLFFYNNPIARLNFLREIMAHSVHQINRTNNPIEINDGTHKIIIWLDQNYHGYAWPAHETHFHTTFYQLCACPFTCLNEISTILEKLIREKFAS